MQERVRCFFIVPVVGDRWAHAATGEVRASINEWGPGAMWDASWYRENNPPGGFSFWGAVEGMNLVVRLPNGHDWYIDGRANNCPEPDKPHRCWVRHGVPPNITVDKNGTPTCSAGAGSILSGDYHGFLRSGVFEP